MDPSGTAATPLSDAAPTHSTPGPSGHDAGSSHDASKEEATADEAPVDSGVDAGSASEYDQENSGDHVLEAHDQESDFSDEG